jgi:hypothetical protein
MSVEKFGSGTYMRGILGQSDIDPNWIMLTAFPQNHKLLTQTGCVRFPCHMREEDVASISILENDAEESKEISSKG